LFHCFRIIHCYTISSVLPANNRCTLADNMDDVIYFCCGLLLARCSYGQLLAQLRVPGTDSNELPAVNLRAQRMTRCRYCSGLLLARCSYGQLLAQLRVPGTDSNELAADTDKMASLAPLLCHNDYRFLPRCRLSSTPFSR